MKKTILINGIFGGLIASTLLAIMTVYMKLNPNYEPSPIMGFGGMLLAFGFIYLGLKQQKLAQNGNLSFKEGLLTGTLITLVISTMYVLVWLFIHYLYFPDFMEQYGKLVLKNSKPEDLAAKTAEINQMKEWYKNPIMVILLSYVEVFPFGILVSLVAALILKSKKN